MISTRLCQSEERFPRPSPRLLGEEAHHAPEILVQLKTAKRKQNKKVGAKGETDGGGAACEWIARNKRAN